MRLGLTAPGRVFPRHLLARIDPWRIVAVLVVLLTIPACSPESPVRPTPTDPYIGTWTGSVTETGVSGAVGHLRVVLVDRGVTGFARGTWEWMYENPSFSDRGTVQETLNGALLFELATPRSCESGPVNAFFAPVTLQGNRMRATFTSLVRCLSGTFDLTRQ
jgi:hypothetical protein